MLAATMAGDRRVWRWTAAAGLPLIVLVVVWCLTPRPYYTGTDSVNAISLTPPVPAGKDVCAAGLNLPAATASVELAVASDTATLPALQMTLRAGGRTYRSSIAATPTRGLLNRVNFPIAERATRPASVPASLCVRATGIVGWGVTPTLEGIQPPLSVNGVATDARLAIWYLPHPGARRSFVSELGSMLDRATLFAPGFVRPWLLAGVLFVLLPALTILAVRCLAVAVAGRTRHLAMWLYVLAALNGGAWALITPAFQAPDEVDHFAYVQALVERGQEPTPYQDSARQRWSTAEKDALLGSAMLTDHQSGDSRAPWLTADARRYEQLVAATGANQADGGGHETASSYGPLYYLAVAPGYAIGSSGSAFSELTLVRLCSALIGALAAVFAYLTVRELAPGRPWLGALAGLLVAFQPMYSFLSGSVNNDIGIDAGAAAVAYLLIRMLRRGITWRTTLPLGLLLGLLPFVKGSAYDLYPLTALAVGGALWRRRPMRWTDRRELTRDLIVPAAAGAGAFAAADGLSIALRPPPPTSGAIPVVTTASGSIGPVLHHPLSFLTYLWEVFLPALPGMHPHFPSGVYPAETIFVRRGWAAFGWYDVFFPGWVYRVLLVAMIATAVLGLLAWRRERWFVSGRRIELALLASFPIVVVVAFEAVFYVPVRRQAVAEFGRYAFPALVPLAALVIGALHGFGRRRMLAAGTALLAAMLALSYASQLLTLTAFYA